MSTLLALALGMLLGAGLGSLVLERRFGRASSQELRRSREEVSRRLADVFALQELSYALSESLQPRRIAEQIVGYLTRFTDVEGALVALTSEAGRNARVAAATGGLGALRDREVGEGDEGLLVQCLGREQMLRAEEADGTRPVVASGVRVRRIVVFPLRAHGVTIGAMAAADPRAGRFEEQALRLLSTVATHAAVVLSNAKFFDLVRAGRDQWETTFNALTEGLAVVDASNRIRRANRSMAALVGSTTTALSGRSLPDVLLPNREDLLALLEAARRNEPVQPLTGRSARDRVLRIGAAPMRGEGDEKWAVVLAEDVTEQEILESQLIQSEKMAAVGQLVSGVAHELNNPLTSITGLAEFLLEQNAGTERERDHLRVIREQADRAGRIVRNLLTFARKGPAEVEEFSLNDLVQRTVTLIGYEVKLREIVLGVDLDPALPTVVADRYQIQQVVLNLVTNALHAVEGNPPSRPRAVTISTTTAEDTAVLRVSDTGPGIDEKELPLLFTPFYTTKDPGKGTGLGLSISFRILEGHGGSLATERPAAGGAAFVMRLPLRAAVPIPQRPATGRQPKEPAPRPGERGAVLVVDEDPAVRRMLAVLLGADERRIDVAADTFQATAYLRAASYDLVIADARVPVSAGERFADYLLREWPALRTRTVFLTADVRPDTEAWLRALGCPFFFKPFKIAELKAALSRLGDRGPASALPSGAPEDRVETSG